MPRKFHTATISSFIVGLYFWYPLFSQKMQVTQIKCIRFYLKLNSRQLIGAKECKRINWPPTKERAEKRVPIKVLKYCKMTSRLYANELLPPT